MQFQFNTTFALYFYWKMNILFEYYDEFIKMCFGIYANFTFQKKKEKNMRHFGHFLLRLDSETLIHLTGLAMILSEALHVALSFSDKCY